jgi:3-hydroxyisobutyrate dehydrogenase-like beta-hydroxyacid dehydrogenase
MYVCMYVCRLSVPLPSTAVASDVLTQAEQLGLGECDFASVYHTLAAVDCSKVD